MGSSPARPAPLADGVAELDPAATPPSDGQASDRQAPDRERRHRTTAGSDDDTRTVPREPVRHRGPLDDLANRVLRLGDEEPRALLDLQGSLVVSAVRCLLAYVVVPVMLPLVAWADVVATPLSLVLSLLAIALSVRSLRRIWQAQWSHRVAYTGFIAVVIGLLVVTVVVDVASLLS